MCAVQVIGIAFCEDKVKTAHRQKQRQKKKQTWSDDDHY